MNQSELKTEIEKLMETHFTGTLATVVNKKPTTRYMTFFHDGLTLYTPTSIDTHKAEEIEENPHVHVLLGYTGEGFNDTYIEFEGQAVMRQDQDTIQKFWNEELERYFEGPNDPKLVFLELKPEQIRLMNKLGEEPQVLTV